MPLTKLGGQHERMRLTLATSGTHSIDDRCSREVKWDEISIALPARPSAKAIEAHHE